MADPAPTQKSDGKELVGVPPIDTTLVRLARMTGEVKHYDLLVQMLTTVTQIGREKFSRGDLKVVNATLREMRQAFRVFRPYRGIRKVAVFGSARTKENAPIYRSAVRFSKQMSENGWMVITGGSTGIMKAGHEGAGREHSFGLNIQLPFEQQVNSFIEGDKKLVHFKYFFVRKLAFIKESDATVLYPGGFGTHDEGTESLTLVQTGKNEPRPIVLVDTPKGNYWDDWLRFVKKSLLSGKMIDVADLDLMTLVKDPKEACRVVLQFYKVYHSLRYVKDMTVLRLNREISDRHVAELNRRFSSILTKGKIEETSVLREEMRERDIRALPRLKMYFNRRNYGRLKQLIDFLNEG